MLLHYNVIISIIPKRNVIKLSLIGQLNDLPTWLLATLGFKLIHSPDVS